VLDLSQESQEVDSDSLVQLTEKLINIIDLVNMPNSFMTIVLGAPEIDKHQIISIKLEGSGAPENSDLIRRFWYHNSTSTVYNENVQLRQILTREYLALRNFT